MSTQGSTPDVISSILLAMWRMHTSKPEKVLLHLMNPNPPNDYRHLDALATLCSFVPQCESAATVVELGVNSIHLYVAVSPSVPPTLRNAMAAWIRLIRQMSESSVIQTDPMLAGSLDTAGPVGNFIADVYRVCHAKLLDVVQDYDQARQLLEEVSSAESEYIKYLKLDVSRRSSLVDSLKVLIGMAEQHGIAASSVEEILELHRAARTAGKSKDLFPEAEFLPLADRLSEAVDCIVAFATSKGNRGWLQRLRDVHWIDAAATRDIIATVDQKDFIESEESFMVFPYEMTIPPKGISPVEGSPGQFKATSVVHCESALLQHTLNHNLSVDPYIGASRPVCYACLMLARACNTVFGRKFAVGRRCEMGMTMDPTWMLPEMGSQLYNMLVSNLRNDFESLSNKTLCDNARRMPIFNDTSFLPENANKAAGL